MVNGNRGSGSQSSWSGARSVLFESRQRSPGAPVSVRRGPASGPGTLLRAHLRAQGKVIGKGGFGTAYVVRVDATLHSLLNRAAAAAEHRVTSTPVPLGSCVVLKVIPMAYERSRADFYREARLHAYLASTACDTAAPECGVPCARNVVPAFYGAFVLPTSCGDHAFMIMSKAPGSTLRQYLGDSVYSSPRLTPELYMAIERAVLALWIAGVAHTDMSLYNIMVDRRTMRVTILDFGLSVRLSPEVQAIVTADLHKLDDNAPMRAWKHIENALRKNTKRAPVWASNISQLAHLRASALRHISKAKLASMRRAMWLCNARPPAKKRKRV